MSNKCPKCKSDNPGTATFCADCGTQLPSIKDIEVTETIETPKEELTRGTTFAGRYEIIEELGRGGMGRVYRVEDTKLKQEVALKLIKPGIAKDKKTIERFRNELTLARNIRHKNVCGMFDLGETEGAHFITMEYVRGEDLRSSIRRFGQLPIGKSISIANQICDGLAEAHRQGVVHRDLKSNNIMIDKEGNVRIMDFGIARSLETKAITGAGVMIGTPEYMSPEQVEGKEVDQRSDIYSLGVIIYEMVTGQVPFEGDTPFSIGVKQKSEIPRPPIEINSQIPDDLNNVILRCLEKEKENRYQSTGEVRSELINVEKGIPTTKRVIPERKPLTSREITVQLSTKRLFIPALIVIAIVILGLLIWKLLPQKEVPTATKIENSVAIINFENQTGDKSYDYLQKAIPSLIITSLEQTRDLYVATRERMRDLLKQMGKENIELINSDLGFEACRKEGIEALVIGSFIKMGDTFAIDVKILDVETMKLITSVGSKGDGIESILKTQINKLSSDIAEGIGISKQKIEETQSQIADVTTSSMEAYNYFIRGIEEYEKMNYEAPLHFFERAVELDPAFAMAHLYLGRTQGFLGNTEERNKSYEKAMTLSHKVKEKERLYIEERYANAIEKNPEKRLRILKQISEKYPKEKRAHRSLANYYRSRRNYDKAIEKFGKALKLDPDYGPVLNNLAASYKEIGDFEKALEYYKRYATVSPGDANPFDSMANCYFVMGRLDEAMTKFKEAVGVRPDFIMSYNGIGYIYALKEDYSGTMEWTEQSIASASSSGIKGEGHLLKGFYLYWQGSLDESLTDLIRAKALFEEVGNDGMKSGADLTTGWVHCVRGEFETSKILIKSCWDIQKQINPQNTHYNTASYNFYLGLIDLEQGEIDSAKSRLAEMKSLLPEIDSPSPRNITVYRYDILDSEILLVEGFPEKAITVCKKSSPRTLTSLQYGITITNINLVSRDVLARAYQQNRELDKAIVEYERLITFDPNSKERRLIHPKYYYRLAKLYEQQGDTAKATEHYEKFLSLWKDADPGTAEVGDAMKRLAGLHVP